MATLNLCQFIGNCGGDPEIKFLPSGEAVANFSLAANETWKDKDSGEKKERTEWIRCVAFGRRAEVLGEYTKKGSPLYVSGKMRTRKWQDKDGQDRYTTEIVVDEFQFLGGKQAGDGGQKRAEQQAESHGPQDFDDDIPF